MRPMIGVQMSTIKDKVAELGVYEAMRRCAEIGYRSIEVSQVPMTPENVSAMAAAHAEYGIKVTALSAAVEPMFPGLPGESLAEQFDKIVADCHALGCRALRIGMMPFGLISDDDGSLAFIARAEAAATRLRDEGITLSYHNHHVELRKVGGVPLLERMRTDTEVLAFELDVHWLQRGGVDPVSWISRYAGRVPLLHLKDYRIGPVALPEGPFDPVGFRNAFYGVIEFAEIGEGNLDVRACVDAGVAGGCEHFYVEQDETYGRDPFESLAISKANLVDLGYDWFA